MSDHETIFVERGHCFVAEFFADHNYSDYLIIQRQTVAVDPAIAAERTLLAVRERATRSIGGRDTPVWVETICAVATIPTPLKSSNRFQPRLGV